MIVIEGVLVGEIFLRKGEMNPKEQRQQALENLWSAIKDEENWKLGYNPAIHEAIKALKELGQRDKYSEET